MSSAEFDDILHQGRGVGVGGWGVLIGVLNQAVHERAVICLYNMREPREKLFIAISHD